MNVDLPAVNVLSLCSGYGGIDLGIRLAIPQARTRCYVEIEGTAAKILAARIADGSLDDAPLWSNLKTFDGKPWRGVVDILVGGYPCQPFSCAGKQLGAKDPRHLWPHIARIVREVQPEWCFFENVDAHLRLGGHEVFEELDRMGYGVACGLFSAEEVGAPHRRLRLFILAHKHRAGAVEDASRLIGPRQERQDSGRRRGIREAADGLADSRNGLLPLARRRSRGRAGTGSAGTEMADAGRMPEHESGKPCHEESTGQRRHQSLRGRTLVADSPEPRSPQLYPGERDEEECAAVVGRSWPAFPPGPNDLAAWKELLAFDPTLEPALCGPADGAASRVDQLRALGNGCVPLVVAHAYRTLRQAFPS